MGTEPAPPAVKSKGTNTYERRVFRGSILGSLAPVSGSTVVMVHLENVYLIEIQTARLEYAPETWLSPKSELTKN